MADAMTPNTGSGGIPHLLRTLLARVFVAPLRQGWPRPERWPAGYRAVGALTGLILVVCLLGLAVTSLLPDQTPLVPPPAAGFITSLGPQFFLLAVTFAFALGQTAGLHAPVPLAVALWLLTGLALICLQTVGGYSFPDPLSYHAVIAWLVLGGFALLRRRRRPAWWEFAVVWVVLLLPPMISGSAAAAITGIAEPNATGMAILIYLIASAAIPVALLTGAALSAVAASVCLWFVELFTSRQVNAPRATRTLAGATGVVLVVIAGIAAWVVIGGSLTPRDGWLSVGAGAVLVALSLLVWALIDRLATRAGAPRASLSQLLEHVSRAAWPAALLVGLSIFVVIAALAVQSTLRVQWNGLPFSDPAVAVAEAIADAPDLVNAVMQAAACAGCLALAVVLAVRGGRAQAQLLGAVSAGQAILLAAGPLGIAYDAAAIGLVSALLIGGVLVWRAIRGRLDPVRAEAHLAAALIAATLVNVELVTDPVGTLLVDAGGGLAVAGLLWTVLTSGELAGGDSPRFPRPSRVLLTLANLLIGVLLIAGTRVLQDVAANVTLDDRVQQGATQIGVPLLVSVILTLLARPQDGALAAPTLSAPSDAPASSIPTPPRAPSSAPTPSRAPQAAAQRNSARTASRVSASSAGLSSR